MQPRSLTLFVTHYPELAEFEDEYPKTVGNFHMSFLVHNDDDEQGKNTWILLIMALFEIYQLAACSHICMITCIAKIPSKIVADDSLNFLKFFFLKFVSQFS